MLALPAMLAAQLTLVVDSIPGYTPPGDDIYFAGTLNGWDPGNPDFVLAEDEVGNWWITLPPQPDGTTIQFKFTRGDWGKVEKGPSGEEIQNRIYAYGNGDTVYFVVYNWADHSGGNSTAADNVEIMDEAFYIPQLDRERTIWIYLPPGYDTSAISYPVLYMHDGQNLFDAATSFVGEWNVDETLNNLAEAGYCVPIVVGINHGGALRLDEYTPWAHPMHGGGDGDLYAAFIVETLKPYIDENYRTLPQREHTGIMGSSLGGLVSHYAALNYQDIFSKAGIFSPSYWFSDSVWSFTADAGLQEPMKLYLMCGSLESMGTVANMLQMHDTLLQNGFTGASLFSKVVPGGEHNEILWRDEFEEAYLWLFGSWASDIRENLPVNSLKVYPNPVKGILKLPTSLGLPCDTLKVVGMTGREVMAFTHYDSRELDVSSLRPGIYLLFIKKDGKLYQAKFVK